MVDEIDRNFGARVPVAHIYRDVLGRMGSVYALDATTAMAACHEPRLTHNCHTRHTRGRWRVQSSISVN
jgi:hypothetical protein